jgi:hypothetical protein
MVTASFSDWRCALQGNPAGWDKGDRHSDDRRATVIQKQWVPCGSNEPYRAVNLTSIYETMMLESTESDILGDGILQKSLI